MVMVHNLLRTILRALVKIAGESIYCVSIGNGRSTTGSKPLILNVNDISIPPLSCNHKILAFFNSKSS